MKTLLLRCPQCKNQMKCQPRGSIIGKKKACVYCGKNFQVMENILQ